MQGCEAVEGATVHFHQAVRLQVPAEAEDEETVSLPLHRQHTEGQSV